MSMHWKTVGGCIVAVSALGAPGAARQCDQGCTTTLISAGPTGAAAHNLFGSYAPKLSANGRYVVYYSYADDLVPGDTNDASDVFIHDLAAGTTRRVSELPGGIQVSGASNRGHVSPDGRFVAFTSTSSELVPFDTNNQDDVFVRDLVLDTLVRVSVSSTGAQSNSDSEDVALSADGQVVLFDSRGGTLVPGDTNIRWDVFVHDAATGATERVSVGTAGQQGAEDSFGAEMSLDRRFVAFYGTSSNFVPGDTNGVSDAFVRDRLLGTTERVSVGPGGAQANGGSQVRDLSPDGRWVLIGSYATNLVPNVTFSLGDAYVHDRWSGANELVSVSHSGTVGNGYSAGSSISSDGRTAWFYSEASDLVAGDTNAQYDTFVRDLDTGTTTRVSLATSGVQGDSVSYAADGSPDATLAAFESLSSNFAAVDDNDRIDIFLRTCACQGPATYCVGKPTSLGCLPAIAFSGAPSASARSGFTVSASPFLNNKFACFFYGTLGATVVPFQGGALCVRPPLVRTALQSTGGNAPPNDCSGVLSIDFNAYIASGVDPALITGQSVWTQSWCRDPGLTPSVTFSNALAFVIGA